MHGMFVSMFTGMVLLSLAALAIQPRLLRSLYVLAPVAGLGGAIGAGAFFLALKRSPSVRDRVRASAGRRSVTNLVTWILLGYVGVTLIDLRAAPPYQVANAGLFLVTWFCYIAGTEGSPYVGAAAGLMLLGMAVVWTMIHTRVFGIPAEALGIFMILCGAIGVWFNILRIVRRESA